MRYKHFKNADIDVSELAVGTWGLDSNRWSTGSSREEAIDAIRMMVAQGVNLIDTAANYGNGAAEQIVGEAIKTIDRSKILISTKFGVPNDFYKRNVRGVYRDAKFGSVLRELASSLRNLQTDYVDFYFLHWPDPSTPIAETMCALNFAADIQDQPGCSGNDLQNGTADLIFTSKHLYLHLLSGKEPTKRGASRACKGRYRR